MCTLTLTFINTIGHMRWSIVHLNWFISIKPKLSDKMSLSMVSMALERVLNCDIKYLFSSYKF